MLGTRLKRRACGLLIDRSVARFFRAGASKVTMRNRLMTKPAAWSLAFCERSFGEAPRHRNQAVLSSGLSTSVRLEWNSVKDAASGDIVRDKVSERVSWRNQSTARRARPGARLRRPDGSINRPPDSRRQCLLPAGAARPVGPSYPRAGSSRPDSFGRPGQYLRIPSAGAGPGDFRTWDSRFWESVTACTRPAVLREAV